MYDAKFRNLLILAAATILPGCLAVNAALGVLGAVGPPAAQLAGAAYTVAEYSYEYGARGRTPDEVFLAKFDWLRKDVKEPDPAAFAGALRRTVAPQKAMNAHPPALVAQVASTPAPAPRATRRPAAAGRHAPVVPARDRVTAPVRKASTPRRALPVHTYAAYTPDPLLVRLDRLENGLAQAERLYLSAERGGLRLSVPPCDGDPCAQGVNGGSSLRLPVMRTAPAAFPPPPASGREPGQSAPPSPRSLNT
ncbi:hypothetical protein [Desulfovibrio sp. Huiquan2017]|uniref:hypothetical protein n=1 Tax=Desulfovibrio sp. Huiquan2017 TaxID=2816861 RepID=UPI001A91D334|nr:hypothetical protein [Desulfovibrio sp. Huiquan2017]